MGMSERKQKDGEMRWLVEACLSARRFLKEMGEGFREKGEEGGKGQRSKLSNTAFGKWGLRT